MKIRHILLNAIPVVVVAAFVWMMVSVVEDEYIPVALEKRAQANPTESYPTNPPPGYIIVTDGKTWGFMWLFEDGRPLPLVEDRESMPPHRPITTREGALKRAWDQYEYSTNEPVRVSKFKPSP